MELREPARAAAITLRVRGRVGVNSGMPGQRSEIGSLLGMQGPVMSLAVAARRGKLQDKAPGRDGTGLLCYGNGSELDLTHHSNAGFGTTQRTRIPRR
jgi:hypothetical protein